jgi:hypothetical protein
MTRKAGAGPTNRHSSRHADQAFFRGKELTKKVAAATRRLPSGLAVCPGMLSQGIRTV